VGINTASLKFLKFSDKTIFSGINTFGSHIILGATLPLLVVVPFTLHRIFPKFLKAKFFDDIKRGELLLFEQDSAFHAAIFAIAGKYTLLHGIRVCYIRCIKFKLFHFSLKGYILIYITVSSIVIIIF